MHPQEWSIQIFPPPVATGGAGTPGAPDKSIQWNNAGVFAGDANLLWDSGTISMLFGVAARIKGDLSNATLSNRLAIQTTTAGGNTILTFLPDGAGTISGAQFLAGSDFLNHARLSIQARTTGHVFNSVTVGAGVLQPILYAMNGTTGLTLSTDADVQLNRGLQRMVVSKNANYTITIADNVILCDASGASFTLTLPPANSVAGLSQNYLIKRIDAVAANTVTIARAGADLIDGAVTYVLGAKQAAEIVCDAGAAWWVL